VPQAAYPLRQAEGEAGFAWREVDIDADPELPARYNEEVPVVFIVGRKSFKYRMEGWVGVSEGAGGERVGRKGRRGEFAREGTPGILGCEKVFSSIGLGISGNLGYRREWRNPAHFFNDAISF
jgi:hypothetical protein